MLRDRGSKKWTAMMLPEHVRLLREWQKEEGHIKPKEVDEQQFEEWHYVISEAMAKYMPLRILFFNGSTTEEAIGYIQHIDLSRGMLRFVNESNQTMRIFFTTIKIISTPE